MRDPWSLLTLISFTFCSIVIQAIRWYDVDPKTFSVLDSHTVITDIISRATYWDENDLEPEWNLEYSAKSTYDDPDAPLGVQDPLSPAFWYDAVERMKVDRELFKTYWAYESKSSAEAGPCHKDSACEQQSLCQMQASTVIQSDACEAESKEQHSKKKIKKQKFAVTRSGRESRVDDYRQQTGIVENLERRQAALSARRDDL